MSKIFYAQENIRNKFKDYTSPKTREQLVNLYALTDNEQQSENIISTLYSTANSHWGTEIHLEQTDDKPYTYCIYNNGQFGNDIPTGKWFVLTDNYYFADNPTNSTRWYTLDEMAQQQISVSPSNIQPDIFSKTTGEKVLAYQYTDKQGNTKYLIRKDKLENEANFRWLTYDEVENTEYSFEEIYKPLHFVNIGTNSATVQLEMSGCRLESPAIQDESIYKIQYSMDGIVWNDYQTYDFRNVPVSNPIIIQGPQITIEPNKTVYFRCDDPILIWQDNTHFHFILSENSNIKAYGNLACMFFGKLFGTVDIKEGEVYLFTLTNMFKDCNSLLRSPIIPESNHTLYQCANMFSGCTNLSEVHCYACRDYSFGDDETLPSYVNGQLISTDWMNGVSQTGDFYCHSKEIYKLNGIDGIPSGWNIHFIKPLCIKAYRDACDITLENIITNNGVSLDPVYEYTADKVYNVESHWKTYEVGTTIRVEKDSTIYIRGHRNKTISYNSYMHVKVEGSNNSYAIFSGNILSLVSEDKNIYSTSTKYPSNIAGDGGVFYKLFDGCTKLLFAPEIPTTEVPVRAYNSMFNNCTSLRMNTKLYASNLKSDCYLNMYNGCSSIESQLLDATSYEQIQEIFPENSVMSTSSCAAMFSGCTSLKVHPKIRVESAAIQCFKSMFSGCTSLSSLYFKETIGSQQVETCGFPINIKVLAKECFINMYNGCSKLNLKSDSYNIIGTSALLENVETLATGCCKQMFKDCTNLKVCPGLPAMSLAEDCYDGMFSGCTSLQDMPALPATNLAVDCYKRMFYGCTSLNNINKISAELLAERCCYNMFNGCTSITTAPKLIAKDLVKDCYKYMFANCSSLNNIEVHSETNNLSSEEYTYGWVVNVSKIGTFRCIDENLWTKNSYNGIPTGWAVEEIEYPLYLENMQDSSSTVKLTTVGTVTNVSYEYSYNLVDWQLYTINDAITLANNGDKVYFRGSRGQQNDTNYIKFNLSGKLSVGGNINSLLSSDESIYKNIDDYTTFESANEYTFCDLFYGQTNLLQANKLKLKTSTLSEGCYHWMFLGCTSLQTAPQLPATNLANYCYAQMFDTCRSLNQSPELPAIVLKIGCYAEMFNECVLLKSAPSLPAMNLADKCYSGMFYNCVSLAKAPLLQATSLSSNCYNNMFYGCTSLTEAPKLQATNLQNDCYGGMFKKCTKLVLPPELPATNLTPNCYKDMFYGCTSLTKLPKLNASVMAIGCYSGMFQGCTSIKNIIRLNSINLKQDCYSHMFSGCTSMLLSNPDEPSYGNIYELPSKTLADGCYSYMFENCSSIDGDIVLPAETPTTDCYNGLFRGCTKLRNIFCYLTTNISGCTDNWLADTFDEGTVYYLNMDLLSNNSESGTPYGWQKLQIYRAYTAKGGNIVFDDGLELPARDINGNEIALGYSICNFYENRKDSVYLYRIESGLDNDQHIPYMNNPLYIKDVATNGVVKIGSTSNIIVSRIDFVINKTKEDAYDMYDVVGLAKTVNSNKVYSQYIWVTQMYRPEGNSNIIKFADYPKNRDLIYSMTDGEITNVETIPGDHIIEVLINDDVNGNIYAFPNPYEEHEEFKFASYIWGGKPSCEFILNDIDPNAIARGGAIVYLPKPVLIGDDWFELGGSGVAGSNNICTIGSDNIITWNKDSKLYKLLEGTKIK